MTAQKKHAAKLPRAAPGPSERARPQPEEGPGEGAGRRTLLAVGDLHGDYYRLLRYLRENDLLLPDTLAWNPARARVDVVLVGDYVDWRGESLEEPQDQTPDDPVTGARRILELLWRLDRDLEALRLQDPSFDSHLFPLLGNHDEMMLEAARVFDFMSLETLEEVLARTRNFAVIKRQMADLGLNPEHVERVLRFFNWFVQGGEATMLGFGGLAAWKESMEGDLGEFLRDRLRLGVVVGDRLFAHTVPDHRRFWKPIEEIVALPEGEFRQAREAFLWSRKVWGYDYTTGSRTSPFSDRELDEMLMGFGVRGMVVGHTPLARGPEPVIAFGGRIINLDQHGVPGAFALVEDYLPDARGSRAPLRALARA